MTIIVEPADAGERLDSFLARRLNGVSRSKIQKAISGGEAAVNERVSKPGYRIREADEISIELISPEPLDARPEPIPINIVHEDDDLIVIDKPAGMVVHPGAGVRTGTLANALVYHFNLLSQSGGASRPGIVHRLDMGTSGLIVVAKNESTHQGLAEQFMNRTVEKRYVALVYGTTKLESGQFDGPIGRDPKNRLRMAVRRPGEGRPALTLYRVKERFDEFTLLDVEIKTGRTHQIRVHLAAGKHPVVADSTYSGGRENSIQRKVTKGRVAKLGRPFLHAAQLAFLHPGSGEVDGIVFTSPLPEDLATFLTAFVEEQPSSGSAPRFSVAFDFQSIPVRQETSEWRFVGPGRSRRDPGECGECVWEG